MNTPSHVYTTLVNYKIFLFEHFSFDYYNIIIMENMLKKKGMIVTVAVNGKECVDMFSASEINFYDVILMDLRMPVMNGLEATKAIRLLPRTDATMCLACFAIRTILFSNREPPYFLWLTSKT